MSAGVLYMAVSTVGWRGGVTVMFLLVAPLPHAHHQNPLGR